MSCSFRYLASLSVVTLSLALSACADTGDDDSSAEEAISSSIALSTGIDAPSIEALTTADPKEAAAAVAHAGGESCRVRVVDPANPNVVHVTLTHCTGRFGKHDISGEVTITFSANEDGSLHAEHQSQDLTVDGLPASHVVSADITFDGSMRHVTAHGVWQRVREDGDTLTRDVDHVVDIDRSTHCRTINGTAVANSAKGEVQSVISDLSFCTIDEGVDSCPTGTVEHTKVAKGKHVVEHFDGTNVETIDVHGPKGDKTKEKTLACVPAGGAS